MLSYQHGFHAGNAADVVKHVVLVSALQALTAKPKPLCYLDTHAGAGCYDLTSGQARKRREYRDGIARVVSAGGAPPAIAEYLAAVTGALAWLDSAEPGTPSPAAQSSARGLSITKYPGSPLLAAHCLRRDDRLVAADLSRDELGRLQGVLGGRRHTSIARIDGYHALKAHLPPTERRGLVLIDPPYDRRDEFRQLVRALRFAWQRWPTGVYLAWYPIQARAVVDTLHRGVITGGLSPALAGEVVWDPSPPTGRMQGCGMLVLNPPWQLETWLEPAFAWLCERLAQRAEASYRVHWLAPR